MKPFHLRPNVRLAAALLALSTLAAACGSADDGAASSDDETTTTEAQEANTDCQTDEATEAGDTMDEVDDIAAAVEERGKPKDVAVPTEAATELGTVDIIEGVGDAVTEGQDVSVHYVGVQQSNCIEFDSSWDRGEAASFSLNEVIAGWTEGIVGMKPGGRRELVIPEEMAYGPDGDPNGTLVFIVDLIGVTVPPEPDEAAMSAATERGEPMPAEAPADLAEIKVTDDAAGTGAALESDSSALIMVKMVASSGEVLDSTWETGDPQEIKVSEVIPSLAESLVGMKLGGRRTVMIPPELAYPEGSGQEAPESTFTIVVDLVGLL